MARAICEGLGDSGVYVKPMQLRTVHRSDVATELLDAGALIVGSPTINNNMFPTVIDVLSYLKGLKPKNLVGAAFGSYGWSGEAVRQVEGILDEMNIESAGESITCKYVPDGETLERCFNLGKQIGQKLKNNIKQY